MNERNKIKCLPHKGFSLSAAPLISAAAYWGVPAVTAPLVPCEPPLPPVPALPPQPPLPPAQPPFEPPGAKALPTDKTKKAKKDKVSVGSNILHQEKSVLVPAILSINCFVFPV